MNEFLTNSNLREVLPYATGVCTAKLSISGLLLFEGLDLVLVLDLVVAPCDCEQGSGGGTTWMLSPALVFAIITVGVGPTGARLAAQQDPTRSSFDLGRLGPGLDVKIPPKRGPNPTQTRAGWGGPSGTRPNYHPHVDDISTLRIV
ncbi:hypothetical protein PCANC_26521 [Puccinia coronata f. sp. avenae]|uniref:Uncharacterized protein n=1 Tax=Puccinia coronata f. sp. avenae TaxID=200324 RepID=A0A2N5RYF6_9BASI|nr:hypothetical protein PCANC_26521 [Puccinia coronata f. sp. avenae]